MTERVLAGLPGPRWRWIAAWAALPLVRLALHFAGAPIGTPEMWSSYVFAGVVPAVVYSLAVAYSLWITPRLVRQAVELEPVLERLGASGVKVAPGATSTRGPLTLTAVFCLLTGIPGVINHGLPAAVAVPVVFAVDLALFNALWVYLTVVVGLDHIGRGRLELDPFPEDRSLGLRPVGALAVSSLRAFLIVI
ncbi:MAG TPA: hypothetical protein VNT60_07310, partial [Deinococcales bacterium]|nr:hypothetical protein [Deinococcales bacterium]